MRTLAFLLLIALAPSAAIAEKTPWYEVELIVFARPAASASSELWPDASEGGPSFANARDLLNTYAGSNEPAAAFSQLAPASMRLTREMERLSNSREMNPLLHVAWVQPGLAKEQAVPIRLQAGNSDDGRLDGTVTLILARYLHLEADLRYRRPTDVQGQNEGDVLSTPRPFFRLKESRRMRSKEVHYLDHPLFGVIAVITPYEGPTR